MKRRTKQPQVALSDPLEGGNTRLIAIRNSLLSAPLASDSVDPATIMLIHDALGDLYVAIRMQRDDVAGLRSEVAALRGTMEMLAGLARIQQGEIECTQDGILLLREAVTGQKRK